MATLVDTIAANQIWQQSRDKTLDWLESVLGGAYQNPQESRGDLSNLIASVGFEPNVNQAYESGMIGMGPMPLGIKDELPMILNKYKDKGIRLYASHWQDEAYNRPIIELQDLVIPQEMRRQGMGTNILEDLTKLADENDATMLLRPTDEYGTKIKTLKDFYKNFGFIENKGKKTDYVLSSPFAETMYRYPNKK